MTNKNRREHTNFAFGVGEQKMFILYMESIQVQLLSRRNAIFSSRGLLSSYSNLELNPSSNPTKNLLFQAGLEIVCFKLNGQKLCNIHCFYTYHQLQRVYFLFRQKKGILPTSTNIYYKYVNWHSSSNNPLRWDS